MKVPSFINDKISDEAGNITPVWQNSFNQLFTQLQYSFSDEGLIVPKQPTANINKLNGPQSVGALLYDNNTNELKVNIGGTWKTIQTV